MDESNVLDSSFLERMNTLLANGEVPGLFEGDEYTTLMTQCKEGAQREGLMLDSSEELYKWFTQQVYFNNLSYFIYLFNHLMYSFVFTSHCSCRNVILSTLVKTF